MDDQATYNLTGGATHDPGEMPLVERIRDKIRKAGRITFAEFMRDALYDPKYGYYTSGRATVGTSGDFLTSPSMHPAFGGTVAAWIYSTWEEMGSPKEFHIVEMGAGKGFLCASILSRLQDDFPRLYSALRYLVVESSAFRPEFDLPPNVTVLKSLGDIPDESIKGCFISNELIDAFPVHLVTAENGKLREVYVGCRGEEFGEEVGELSTPEIERHIDRLGISIPDGYRTEVNLQAVEWMHTVSRKVRHGCVLTIDYGYPAKEYYRPERRTGTLLCYYRHTCSEDFYHRVGRQDITAHVEWTSLIEAGAAEGLIASEFTTQRDFLTKWGIQSLLEPPRGRQIGQILLDPEGMGGFDVLVQKKTAVP